MPYWAVLLSTTLPKRHEWAECVAGVSRRECAQRPATSINALDYPIAGQVSAELEVDRGFSPHLLTVAQQVIAEVDEADVLADACPADGRNLLSQNERPAENGR